MSETSLKPVIDKLENLFSKFNEKFYGGELQKAIITVIIVGTVKAHNEYKGVKQTEITRCKIVA